MAEAEVRGTQTLFTVAHDSVTNCQAGAIVNAANEGCLGGGGIDGRIRDLGGAALAQARRDLPILTGGEYGPRCKVGDAKLTVAGDLACEYVIHAVGPRLSYYGPFDDDLKLLEDAYKSALSRAREHDVTKLAFCILSAGIFRGGCPLTDIIKIGINSIAKHVYPGLERVYFCAYTDDELAIASSILV